MVMAALDACFHRVTSTPLDPCKSMTANGIRGVRMIFDLALRARAGRNLAWHPNFDLHNSPRWELPE